MAAAAGPRIPSTLLHLYYTFGATFQVSEEVREAAGDADLIILEGMGRGIETNLHARFRVDSLKLGMIKHKEVRLWAMCM